MKRGDDTSYWTIGEGDEVFEDLVLRQEEIYFTDDREMGPDDVDFYLQDGPSICYVPQWVAQAIIKAYRERTG